MHEAAVRDDAVDEAGHVRIEPVLVEDPIGIRVIGGRLPTPAR